MSKPVLGELVPALGAALSLRVENTNLEESRDWECF